MPVAEATRGRRARGKLGSPTDTWVTTRPDLGILFVPFFLACRHMLRLLFFPLDDDPAARVSVVRDPEMGSPKNAFIVVTKSC